MPRYTYKGAWRRYKFNRWGGKKRRQNVADSSTRAHSIATAIRPAPRRQPVVKGKEFGPFVFDIASGTVDCQSSDRSIKLRTSGEGDGAFRLLCELVHLGRTAGTFEHLCRTVLGETFSPSAKYRLTRRVIKLREKLDLLHPGGSTCVTSVNQVGYQLTDGNLRGQVRVK